ncbi:uncharacterized protein [Anabrus simplex]|uniref:uncharacterized protein n=1 Tax=Anabrus simplex TaxID=316456 RepID=UPI0035A32E59
MKSWNRLLSEVEHGEEVVQEDTEKSVPLLNCIPGCEDATTQDVKLDLAKQGILSLGIVRRNPMPNCKLPTDEELKKEPRGTSCEYVAHVDGADVNSMVWKDNACVTLMSTFTSKIPRSVPIEHVWDQLGRQLHPSASIENIKEQLQQLLTSLPQERVQWLNDTLLNRISHASRPEGVQRHTDKWASIAKFCIPVRLSLAIMIFFATWGSYMLRINISLAIVDMTKKVAPTIHIDPECKGDMGFLFGNHTLPDIQEKRIIPWKQIAESAPVVVLVVLHFCNAWGLNFLLIDGPIYMRNVLGYSPTEGGILAGVPYITRLSAGFVFSTLGNHFQQRKIGTVTSMRKGFTIFSHLIPGTFMFVLSWVGCRRTVAVSMIIISYTFSGASVGGVMANATDLSPRYAGVLSSIVDCMGSTTGIFIPIVVGAVTMDSQKMNQWQIVFLINSAMYVFGAIIYLCWGSGQLQPWDSPAPRIEEEIASTSYNSRDSGVYNEPKYDNDEQ